MRYALLICQGGNAVIGPEERRAGRHIAAAVVNHLSEPEFHDRRSRGTKEWSTCARFVTGTP